MNSLVNPCLDTTSIQQQPVEPDGPLMDKYEIKIDRLCLLYSVPFKNILILQGHQHYGLRVLKFSSTLDTYALNHKEVMLIKKIIPLSTPSKTFKLVKNNEKENKPWKRNCIFFKRPSFSLCLVGVCTI